MTPETAIQILDVGTQPFNAAKLTRQDYANIDTAIRVLQGAAQELAALKAANAKTEPPTNSTP